MLNTLTIIIITTFVTISSTILDLRKLNLCTSQAPFCNTLTGIYPIDNFINNCIFVVSYVCLFILGAVAMGISTYILFALIPIVSITVILYTVRILIFVWRLESEQPSREDIKKYISIEP